ncbi:hypothetical protein AQUCO_00100453v1 [Aquilegia coerulea]|uniref:Uncharacterized protein n=1 Tax=Aquilegia coerulea TaxID=218851 RepID=A0A2G5FAH6_AQUCA|nr:hypothetical protein AQUCO_00100453v1 [Aquilegia coerulea]
MGTPIKMKELGLEFHHHQISNLLFSSMAFQQSYKISKCTDVKGNNTDLATMVPDLEPAGLDLLLANVDGEKEQLYTNEGLNA